MVAIYRGISADPERVAGLDQDLVDLAERHATGAYGGGRGGHRMEWEYLLLTARKHSVIRARPTDRRGRSG
ncbi:MAG: hypothetical protein WAL50_20165 [Kineosporiaceae bacterium]